MPTNKAAIFGLVATLLGTGLGSVAGFNQLMNPSNSASQEFPVSSLPTPSPSPSVAPSPVTSGWLTSPAQPNPTQPLAASDRSLSESDREIVSTPSSQPPYNPTAYAATTHNDENTAAPISQPYSDLSAQPTQSTQLRDQRWQEPSSEPAWRDRDRHLSSLPAPNSRDGRYHCADITKAEAQALLQQGEIYLDPNGDGQACEQGTKGYPSQPDRPNAEPSHWRSRQVSSQPDQDWRYQRRYANHRGFSNR